MTDSLKPPIVRGTTEFPHPSFAAYAVGGWNPFPIFEPDLDWHPFLYCNNMSEKVWKGLEFDGRCEDVRGSSYWIMPAPSAGQQFSARFDPASPLFQTWFGMYVLAPDEHGRRRPPSLELIEQLGIRDNEAWHDFMGAPSGTWEARDRIVASRDEDGPDAAWLVEHFATGTVDVGADNPQESRPPIVMVTHGWQDHVQSFQSRLEFSNHFVYYVGDCLVVHYNAWAEYVNLKGETLNNGARALPGLERMRRSLSWHDSGAGFACPGNFALR